MALKTITSVIDAAVAFIARGWAVVPVPPGAKKPLLSGWQKLRLGITDVQLQFRPGDNIGILVGDASGGLVDVDLDAPEALAAAPAFLAPTRLMHGRPGKANSHWWYIVSLPAPPTVQFEDPDGSMLAELRSSGTDDCASLHSPIA